MPTALSVAAHPTPGNRLTSILFSSLVKRRALDTRRRASIAAAIASQSTPAKRSASADLVSTSNAAGDTGDADAYTTVQSNNYDSFPSAIGNKFLQELRSKRRELREKSKNVSIDLRIDFNRRMHHRPIRRAQDIFDVHFQSQDDEEQLFLSRTNIFTEAAQEQMRDDIYKELNRQQAKRYRKRNRHLIVGRSLLMLMTSLFVMMSLILVYAVNDLYKRATYSDAMLPEQDFIPMSFDQPAKSY